MKPRPIALSLTLILATIASGLAIRFAPLHLPYGIVKYGASALWAGMIYWIVTTLLPRQQLTRAILLSGVISTAVEFFKLVHVPFLDAFRHTIPGILLLGRFFSLWDIVIYWLAIVAVAGVDLCVRPKEQ